MFRNTMGWGIWGIYPDQHYEVALSNVISNRVGSVQFPEKNGLLQLEVLIYCFIKTITIAKM